MSCVHFGLYLESDLKGGLIAYSICRLSWVSHSVTMPYFTQKLCRDADKKALRWVFAMMFMVLFSITAKSLHNHVSLAWRQSQFHNKSGIIVGSSFINSVTFLVCQI